MEQWSRLFQIITRRRTKWEPQLQKMGLVSPLTNQEKEPRSSWAHSLAEALPDGQYRTLKGQGHDIVPDALGPVLEAFLLAQSSPKKSGKRASK